MLKSIFAVMVVFALFAGGCTKESTERKAVSIDVVTAAEMYAGDEENINIVINYNDGTSENGGAEISGGEGIVDIEGKKIYALKAGESIIIVSKGDIKKEVKITVKSAIKVNYFTDAKSVSLKYRNKKEGEFTIKEMTNNNNGWYSSRVEEEKIDFAVIADGKEYNLGGVLGNYPLDPKEPYTTSYREIWVKNGLIFSENPDKEREKNSFAVITINLHTYQETNQGAKLENIAKAINDFAPDAVALQECAQDKGAEIVIESHYGIKIKKDNMAYIITNILKTKYNKEYDYFWDWSHYGWDKWEEGVGVLTKHKIVKCESNFISKSSSQSFWKSRKAARVLIEKEGYGNIGIYSAHMGWWDDTEEPFKIHFDNLIKWQNSNKNEEKSTFTMGDFNIEAGSKGYEYIMSSSDYVDEYLEANKEGLYDATIGGKIDGWQQGDPDGKRIDFIFGRKSGNAEPKTVQRIFTENVYGRVSDHNGVYGTFELK